MDLQQALAARVLCWLGTRGFGECLRLAFYVALEPLVLGSVCGLRFMLLWNHWFWEALAERFACITGFCSGTKVEPKWNQSGTKTEPQSNIVKSSQV